MGLPEGKKKYGVRSTAKQYTNEMDQPDNDTFIPSSSLYLKTQD